MSLKKISSLAIKLNLMRHTLHHLKSRQIWYFFLRRTLGARHITPSHIAISQRVIFVPAILNLSHANDDFKNYEFSFLNRTLSFSRDMMSWNPNNTHRLWLYNLHYFDYLRDPTRPLQQKIALVNDWIMNNPQGCEPAWEPYTASLRIVNWCLFFWSLPKEQISEHWLHSLHTQARWLEHNLELHILANHYFENIKAMLFSALFFDDRNSAQWLSHFQKELVAQLREQTLPDGGHYERSPQYHCILLEDYLDIYALLHENSALVESDALSILAQTINASLNFLTKITTPDDDIPLFNDSASNIAARPSLLFAKARHLGFNIEILQSGLVELPESGLFGWKSGSDYFLIDCGDIGPAYQPGHTHCDFLSFVLMINGKWLAVDSGVCEYEPGAMRQYVRSTAAHNTVIVDDNEQSEVWKEFRVGRRASRIAATFYREKNKVIFEGAYSGFPMLKANIVHHRRAILTINTDNTIARLEIIDRIEGSNGATHRIETLLHLHPSIVLETDNAIGVDHMSATSSMALHQPYGRDALLSSSHAISVNSRESWYCKQFGSQEANTVISLALTTKLPTTLSYCLDIAQPK